MKLYHLEGVIEHDETEFSFHIGSFSTPELRAEAQKTFLEREAPKIALYHIKMIDFESELDQICAESKKEEALPDTNIKTNEIQGKPDIKIKDFGTVYDEEESDQAFLEAIGKL